MSASDKNISPLQTWLRKLTACLFSNWGLLVVDLIHYLATIMKLNVGHTGMYEILDYDANLELLDHKGKRAIFKRRQQVKFLQDNVIAFQDYAWGDGDILVDYSCRPGTAVDRYREGNQWNILISLRETKSLGDVIDFYTERVIKNGFTNEEEWWQVKIRHQTKQFKLVVIFPPNRPCRRAILFQEGQNRTTVLDGNHLVHLPDGRQQLVWETNKLKRGDTYTFKWKW